MTLDNRDWSSPPAEVASWPAPLAMAFRRRLAQLPTRDESGQALLAAERRAFAELSPDSEPLRAFVSAWPIERQERFAGLIEEPARAGFLPPDAERHAFIRIAAENDNPSIPLLNLADLARSVTD